MAGKKDSKEVIVKFRNKYFLKLVRETNLEEVFSIRVSRFSISLSFGISTLFLIVSIISLIAFTPLREFIPGYPDDKLRQLIVHNSLMVDSLEQELVLRDQYFTSIKNIMDGKDPESYHNPLDTFQNYEGIDFSISKEDSILREKVASEELYSISNSGEVKQNDDLGQIYFYTPVKGIITASFDASKNHYGTDIVAKPNQAVFACLSGTVISSSWSLEYGYVIQIQHESNLISAYKHNSELLKKTGSIVKAGEPIAIIGNSGELTTGPHLHFELWHSGKALDPEEYINF